MAVTYVLIPGAGGEAWYWHRVTAELERRGRAVVAVDLSAGDDDAGWGEYVNVVVAAATGVAAPVVVGQSMGGFAAPMAAVALEARLLVLVNAMIPRPGETGGEWWGATAQSEAAVAMAAAEGRPATDEIDPMVDFFHDVPPEVTAEAIARGEPEQSASPFEQAWPLDRCRTSPPGSWPAAMTGCSRSTSSGGWRRSVWGWRSMTFRAGT